MRADVVVVIISEVIIRSAQEEKKPIYSIREDLVFQAGYTESEHWNRI